MQNSAKLPYRPKLLVIMDTWQDLTQITQDLRLAVAASYLHGSLVGYIAGGGKAEHATWLDIALQEEGLTQDLPSDVLEQLSDFRVATERGLADEEFRFFLLLPDDETPIEERACALVDWCGGFLGGLGLAGSSDIKPTKPKKKSSARIQIGDGQLSADASEAVRDLERIARTEIELDQDDEANEEAFAELTEYVKVGAALIYQELAGFLKPTAQATTRDRTH